MEMSELFEGIGEWGESESEAAEGRGSRGPRRPSGAPSFKPRPAANAPAYVTQTQLEAALTRSDAKIKTVAEGVSSISTRLGALASASKKEADERKKSIDSQSKDLNQKLQLMAMLPILMTPNSATPAGLNDSSGNPIASVLVPDTSSLNKLLPLLLIGGMGSSSGGLGLGGDSSGGDGGMMMLAMILALGK